MNKERLLERLETYKKASKRLEEAARLEIHDDIVIDGVIQRFECTFELSWKLMRSFLEYVGIMEVRSPRGAIQEAYSYGLIGDGEAWIDMLMDRNKTSHIYDEEEAKLIYGKITNKHTQLLMDFCQVMEKNIKDVK